MKLATPLSLAIAAPSLGHSAVVGEKVTIVGYGIAEHQNSKSFGTLRAAELVVTGKPGSMQIRLVDPASGGDRAGFGGCDGDSGAPAIQEISGPLIGVVAWSTGSGDSEGCGGLTGLTPLAPHTDWITATAQKLGSPIDGTTGANAQTESPKPKEIEHGNTTAAQTESGTRNPSASAESGNKFTNRDIPQIVETSRGNEICFNRDYKGKTFSGVLPFNSATKNTFGSSYQVHLGDSGGVYCFISDQTILNRIIDWNRGRMVRVSGTIRTTMFGDVALEKCEMN